jgi:hypothetical protein
MTETQIDFASFVKLVIEALETAGIDYMIGGAVAAWAWGEPRATMDLDLVADIPLAQVNDLSQELEKRAMLVPADIILNTILETRADLPINAIHLHTGLKADIYPVREHDVLRQQAWSRRRLIDLGPDLGEVYLHSPEDLIIYKLWYFSLSRQTKHTRDIISIITSLGDELDFGYITNWTAQRGLSSLWKELLDSLDRESGSEEN